MEVLKRCSREGNEGDGEAGVPFEDLKKMEVFVDLQTCGREEDGSAGVSFEDLKEMTEMEVA